MALPDINEADAHRFFSASCFNRAWDLIRKAERTDSENEQMLLLSQSSLWHWTQRHDCTPRNISIGYWQLSRIHALLGRAEDARASALECLRHSEGEAPFYIGYAHEALARSAAVAGDHAAKAKHLQQAHQHLARVVDERDRAPLRADLESLARE
jgi:hypothetical protein